MVRVITAVAVVALAVGSAGGWFAARSRAQQRDHELAELRRSRAVLCLVTAEALRRLDRPSAPSDEFRFAATYLSGAVRLCEPQALVPLDKIISEGFVGDNQAVARRAANEVADMIDRPNGGSP